MDTTTITECEGCNVCLHGECYACMVGVATGPESHDTCCPVKSRRFSDDGLTILRENPTAHRVHTRYEGERAYWECSCGSGGSGPEYNVDVASDLHIEYAAGEHRINTSRPF